MSSTRALAKPSRENALTAPARMGPWARRAASVEEPAWMRIGDTESTTMMRSVQEMRGSCKKTAVVACATEYTVYTNRAMNAAPTGYWRRLVSMLSPGDWVYRDAHYLVADMAIDAAAAAPWFPDNTFGSRYCEAGLFLHVRHLGRRAIFSPWMIVDDDVALILGRELLG